jgi:hypothetical protein
MGLQEKRKEQELNEKAVPEFKRGLKAVLGHDVDVRIDFSGIESADVMASLVTNLSEETISALKAIATDEIGKQALKGFKTITVKHSDYTGSGPKYADGVLNFTGNWHAERLEASTIRQELEEKLG